MLLIRQYCRPYVFKRECYFLIRAMAIPYFVFKHETLALNGFRMNTLFRFCVSVTRSRNQLVSIALIRPLDGVRMHRGS